MAPNRKKSEEFVRKFLEQGRAKPEELDELIRCKAPETERLEYKGGEWLEPGKKKGTRGKPAEPGDRLRGWTAGFANSGGGVLAVGIAETAAREDIPEKVDGVSPSFAKTPAGLRKRAEDMLASIANALPSPIALDVVEHREGMVLLVGVQRSPDLIACFDEKQPVYWVRTFTGTHALSDIVAADLLVGRRARPTFDISVEARGSIRALDGAREARLSLDVDVTNSSLVWVDALRAGVVFAPRHSKGWTRLPPPIRAAVEPQNNASLQHVLLHDDGEPTRFERPIAPFIGIGLAQSDIRTWCKCELSFALYLVARGHPAQWWEVSGTITPHDDLVFARLNAERCRARRARVFTIGIGW